MSDFVNIMRRAAEVIQFVASDVFISTREGQVDVKKKTKTNMWVFFCLTADMFSLRFQSVGSP